MKSSLHQLILALRDRIQTGEKPPKMKQQCKMARTGQKDLAIAWQAAMILEGRRKVLTSSQTKLDKAQAEGTGYMNRGLTLSPADEARAYLWPKFTTCPGATDVCTEMCVGSKQGQGKLSSSEIARIGRTVAYYVDSARWWQWYDLELSHSARQAAILGYKLAMRVNVASDNTWLAEESARRHPTVTHYDYSVIPAAVRRPNGVHRVYSRKDGRDKMTLKMLNEGHGVAVVFDVNPRKKKNELGEKVHDALPATWNGYPVIDGDLHDLWFLQAEHIDGPFVVGLRSKGTNAQREDARFKGFSV